ncbi:MAG TPA: SpoIID/LytB domain-containing protein, partial [Tepidisphaeraceae bacterium]|nr:SpoIID/LytB domain-containing protein [Tepidisphaeraceae bacterium]
PMIVLRRLRRCILLLWILVASCAPVTDSYQPPAPLGSSFAPIVRIRLLESQSQVTLSSTFDCWLIRDGASQRISLYAVPISLSQGTWHLGDRLIAGGDILLRPANDAVISVNSHPYRGDIRLVPVASDHFDVINVVDIDSYLQGVLSAELYPHWLPETYEAQAIVARTYALYVARVDGTSRYWDLYPDQRSQMYGGLAAETTRSRQAVAATRGLVLTYGPPPGKLFEAYFSSCCGGVTQTAALVFPGAPDIPPLQAQFTGNLCSASPNFNWPPVTIPKVELARRIRLWGMRQTPIRPEASLGAIVRVDLEAVNRFGRPARFSVTDDRGLRYIMNAEEFRDAVNTDAAPGTTLKSSFCKVDGDPSRSDVLFYDGHGSGHGVGMCQWCAEARAELGWSHQGILAAAFPQSRLVKAY